jgi:hypothetical protein
MVVRHRTGLTAEEDYRYWEQDLMDRAVVATPLDKVVVMDSAPPAPAERIYSWLRRSINDPMTCSSKVHEGTDRGDWCERNVKW